MDTNLDQIVRTRLEARKGDWQAISIASNISYSWLSKFVNGHIPNPGYATLTRLHKALQSQEPTHAGAEAAQGV